MRRRITAVLLAAAFAVSVPAGAAFADNPHAGKSGKFQGSSGPCHEKDTGNPHCPPHGG